MRIVEGILAKVKYDVQDFKNFRIEVVLIESYHTVVHLGGMLDVLGGNPGPTIASLSQDQTLS